MTKTLITGSSGFLGTTLLRDYGDQLGYTIACSRSHQHTDATGKSYSTDICSSQFFDIVQENSPSAVIHTAARSIVRDCEKNPAQAFMSNVQGTVNVLEAVRRMDSDIPVVVLETDKVYGQQSQENIPTNETHPLLGFTPYEYSKVLTANVCDFYRQYYGMKIYSLRPANIYGYWDRNTSRIVPNTISKLLRGESPIVFSDSKNQLREYLYVNDLCQIIVHMLEGKMPAGAYNMSSGVVKSPSEVIETITAVTGLDVPIEYVEKPFEFKEIHTQALDGSKILKHLPNFTFSTLEDGIEDMWQRIQFFGYLNNSGEIKCKF